MVVFLPLNVSAKASITSLDVNGELTKEVGKNLPLSIHIGLSGVANTSANTTGVWFVAYELDFDDNVLAITSIDSSEWDTEVYQESGKYYVLAKATNKGKNTCVSNGVLICSDYYDQITFTVKNTSVDHSSITVKNISVAVLDMSDSNKEYTINDATELESSFVKVHSFLVTKASGVVNEPISIVSNNKPIVTPAPTPNPAKGDTETNSLSTNNYLDTLIVEGHDFDYLKTKNDYNITLKSGENQVKVTAKASDRKSKVNIIGSDDLAKNNYVIKVEVTSESGVTNTYKITATNEFNVNNDEQNTNDITDEVENKVINFIYIF